MRIVISLLTAAIITFAGAQDYIFGIVYDSQKFDGSFNEGTWRGMEEAMAELRSELGLEIGFLEFEGTPDSTAGGMRSMAEAGAELIVAPGFAHANPITSVSAEYPDTSFVILDAVVEGPNVRSGVFKEHEGSFLVGFIAGTLSQTGVVGFIGGMDIPLIRKFNLGYEEGVKYACPDCTVLSNYIGVTNAAWNDPVRAIELATVQQSQGADIFYAAAGGSGAGVIQFVTETMCYRPASPLRETPLAAQLEDIAPYQAYAQACQGAEPLFFIGVDSNQNPEGDTDGSPDTLNHGLTSMLKRVDVAAYNAIYDIVNGTFTPGVVVLGLAEDGVGFAMDEYNEALIPSDLLVELEVIRDMIVSGQLVVTDYTAQ